jgi:hypothetical protein
MQTVCAECGRMLDERFIFCPWCGANRMQPGCSRTDACGKFYRREQQRRMSCMESTLDILEKELSVLALSEEMHR